MPHFGYEAALNHLCWKGFAVINADLVGGFKHECYFPFHIWDVILPIDELIFFKMVIAPPTSNVWIQCSHFCASPSFSPGKR